MPVVKIFYKQDLENKIEKNLSGLEKGINDVLLSIMKADPLKCQILFLPVRHCSPLPVFVDFQFREQTYRTRAVLEEAMNIISETLMACLNVDVRIRAFDIKPELLHALDRLVGEDA